MNISVLVRISESNVSVRIPEWNLSKSVLSRVAYHPKKRKIMAIGDDAVAMKKVLESREQKGETLQILVVVTND